MQIQRVTQQVSYVTLIVFHVQCYIWYLSSVTEVLYVFHEMHMLYYGISLVWGSLLCLFTKF